MEQFNKIISFVLGLVVVVIFLAVVTGKINLKGKVLPFSKGATPTTSLSPTPTPKKTTLSLNQIQPIQKDDKSTKTTTTQKSSYEYHSYGTTNIPSSIPSTGPGLLLPLALSSFIAGKYLNRKEK